VTTISPVSPGARGRPLSSTISTIPRSGAAWPPHCAVHSQKEVTISDDE